MTRGTLFLALKDKVLHSIEFNGDMYGSPQDSKNLQKSGYYKEVINRLKRSKNKEDFKNEVEAFNKENFQYGEKDLVFEFAPGFVHENEDKKLFDFTENYYKAYFSDYLYFKNISGESIYFKDAETKKVIECPDGKIATFNFGRFVEVI